MKQKVRVIGIAHNVALEHAELMLAKQKAITASSFDTYQTVDFIVDVSSESLVSQGYSIDGINLQQIKETLYQSIVDSSYNYPITQTWQPTTEAIFHDGMYVQKEFDLVGKVRSIFEKDYSSFSPDSCYKFMRSQLESAKVEFENYNWAPGTGDLCGGLIYLSSSSLDFWWEYYLQNDIDPNSISQNGILDSISKWLRRSSAAQCDAAGYLKGWGESWLIDEEEKESVRIKKGLMSGASWSGFKLTL